MYTSNTNATCYVLSELDMEKERYDTLPPPPPPRKIFIPDNSDVHLCGILSFTIVMMGIRKNLDFTDRQLANTDVLRHDGPPNGS